MNLLKLFDFFSFAKSSDNTNSRDVSSLQPSQNTHLDHQAPDLDQDQTGIERRKFTRSTVVHGPLIVFWKNEQGKECHGEAINISITSVLFSAVNFTAQTIERIEYPPLSITLKIKKSHILRRSQTHVVAIIEEFHNSLQDQMQWVEVLSRVD